MIVLPWLISCSTSEITDTGFETGTTTYEDTFVFESVDCPLQAQPTSLSFEEAPAMSLPQRMTITLTQDCADPHVLLSAPKDWIEDAHFSVTLPSSTQAQDQSTLEIEFTPSWDVLISKRIV